MEKGGGLTQLEHVHAAQVAQEKTWYIKYLSAPFIIRFVPYLQIAARPQQVFRSDTWVEWVN